MPTRNSFCQSPPISSSHNFKIEMNDSLSKPSIKVEPWLSSEAKQRLIYLFRTGKIKIDTPPLSIWNSDSIYQSYNLNNFRNNFNRLKKTHFGISSLPKSAKKEKKKPKLQVKVEPKKLLRSTTSGRI